MTPENPLMHALAGRISVTVKETGRCLITSPAELTPLKAMGIENLRQFAADNGWNVVPRLGFTQIEFFTVHLPRAAAGLV